jgi:hypothetical protein
MNLTTSVVDHGQHKSALYRSANENVWFGRFVMDLVLHQGQFPVLPRGHSRTLSYKISSERHALNGIHFTYATPPLCKIIELVTAI